MKLLYAPPSPFARKPRILARELGLIEVIEEIVVNPYKDDAQLLSINPAGMVPALVTDTGEAVIDSPLICRHLCESAGVLDGLATNAASRWPTLGTEALADAVMDCAVAVVEERRHTDAEPSPAFIARKMGKIARSIDHTPVQTGDGRDTPDLGQIAIACALSYLDFRFAEFDWRARRPDLAAWHTSVEGRTAFRDTRLEDHPV